MKQNRANFIVIVYLSMMNFSLAEIKKVII